MENKIVMKDGIIQKPISLLSWKIIAASKGYCRTIKRKEGVKPMDVLQELLKEETLLQDNLSYKDLYYWLTETVLEVFNSIQIENILKFDITDYFNKITRNQTIEIWNGKREKHDPSALTLTYEDLCNILLDKLSFLQIRESNNGEIVDLFVICKRDGKIISIEEAEREWFEEKFDLTKKV